MKGYSITVIELAYSRTLASARMPYQFLTDYGFPSNGFNSNFFNETKLNEKFHHSYDWCKLDQLKHPRLF